MRDTENIRQIIKLKPDMMGFIFYPESKRYTGQKLKQEVINLIPKHIKKTGVFVDMAPGLLIDAANDSQFDLIQLHGDETPAYCERIKQEGFEVMKAFSVKDKIDMKELAGYEAHCKYFLFDTQCKAYGGSGKKFDWHILEQYTGNIPFLLSGGIGPGDAHDILNINHPQLQGVDINSQFETAPGIKDTSLIKDFIKSIQ